MPRPRDREKILEKSRFTFDSLPALVGQELGVSSWITVDQDLIDRFAETTGDRQWIHVDPVRAASGPYGTTIAHGYLTLSLLPLLFETGFAIDDVKMGVNYGLNRVRFPAPVPAGSRLRGRFELLAYEPIAGGAQLTLRTTVELGAGGKPACIAESVSRRFV